MDPFASGIRILLCVRRGFFCPPVCFFPGAAIMVVPFSNRAAVARLPELALAKGPATVKEVIDDFANQCEPFNSVLECVQLVKGRTLRIHFPNADVREDVISGGLTFRGHPLTFSVPSTFKWVSVLDLPYGTPDGELSSVLGKYGQIATTRSEVYKDLYTGTKLVKMTVKAPIPSRVTITGHVCTVFYRGQIRSCFRCGVSGHEAKKCPRKNATLSASTVPTITTSVEPPTIPSETHVSPTPPTSPRTFACVVSSQVVPTVISTLPSSSTSPFPKEVLTLPLGPIDETAHAGTEMDTETQSNKRPYSPISDSEWTDTDASERTRPRLEEQPPLEPTIASELLDPNIRDRSPLRTAAAGSDSSSDSSGKSLTSNASVIDPPAAQLTTNVEPPLLPTRAVDRRPLSTRYKEYCSTAPEYTAEEAADLVESMLEVERQMASPTHYVNQQEIELQQIYDHLKLDCSIAENACDALDPRDPHLNIIGPIYDAAAKDLAVFEAAHPVTVKAAEELYFEKSPANESKQRSESPSDSPAIPDGQLVKPRTEGPSTVDTPQSQVIPEEVVTDSAETPTNSGPLNIRRSRHKSDKSQVPTELASCLRTRTTPALPGTRKKQQPPPDSPYTPLVTDSGYLITNSPSGTLPTKPQRPDTGAAGAISPSPSSVDHP